MRAIFLNIELQELELIEISGDQAHHLNVIRIKENEEILILNGKGKSALANVLSIQKKNIKVKIKKIISYERKHDISNFAT
jgi:16S rRNA (uracil1498-N3)-methyltransferase